MEKTQINFKQERDFGEIFSAVFNFIGQEFKQLMLAILVYVGPLLLVGGALLWIFFMNFQNTFLSLSENPEDFTNPFSLMGNFFLIMIIIVLIGMLAVTMLRSTVLAYIKLYVEKGKNNFTISDIGGQIMNYYFPLLGIMIVVTLFTGIAMMFCILPGIYVGVSLSIIYMIYVFEKIGFGDAFSRSFKLIGKKWWLTLGLIIVAGLMIGMISYIMYIPMFAFSFKDLFTNMQNPEALEEFVFPKYIFVSYILYYIVYFLLQSIPFILLSFHYFSLVEMQEKPSLEEKINQIETNE